MSLRRLFRNRTITSLYMWGASVLFLLVALFTALAIYIEYWEFDREAQQLRRQYLEEQKKQITYDTNRVLHFIENEYRKRHGTIDDTLLQAQIKNAIEELYGRPDGTGYIFIYGFDGTCLSDPVQRHNVGKNLYNFRDPDGVQVIKELIDVSRRPSGGFVRYTWIKPTTKERSPKISYARAFEPWQWMVGTGVYLDEVERVISQRRTALQEKTLGSIFKILFLMGVLFIVGLIGVRLLNGIIRREVESFNRYFERAAKSHILIDESQVRLREFKKMVRYINDMVNEIHERKRRLKEINALLEEKVEAKTADLRERNRLLREEKAFSEALVAAQDSFIRQSIHEVNTPLAVIMTHIDIFKMKYGENRYLAKIEAAAKMIANIYDDLSYMVKKNRFEYTRGEIDFSQFLHERIRFFQEIALGNRLGIVNRIDEGIGICFSDIELQRIVDNNLSNAIKYARENTYITVTLRREAGEILLEFLTQSRQPISDTRKIFEAFHREDREAEGFGLGLQIVRSICEKNGVEVEVSSDKERTIFRYRFREEAGDASTAA
jgi:signal transduction histidine kinase